MDPVNVIVHCRLNGHRFLCLMIHVQCQLECSLISRDYCVTNAAIQFPVKRPIRPTATYEYWMNGRETEMNTQKYLGFLLRFLFIEFPLNSLWIKFHACRFEFLSDQLKEHDYQTTNIIAIFWTEYTPTLSHSGSIDGDDVDGSWISNLKVLVCCFISIRFVNVYDGQHT